MKTTITAILLFCATFCLAEKPYKCKLEGAIFGRNSKTLILKKATDARDNNKITIPIINNAFEFTFDVNETEAYMLIFKDELDKGMWHEIVFFPYEGTVKFKLYSFEQTENNVIEGGILNKEYADFMLMQKNTFEAREKVVSEKRTALNKIKKYYTAEHDSLINISNTTSDHSKIDPSVWARLTELEKTGDDLTPEGKLVKRESNILTAEKNSIRYDYIKKYPDMLAYYFIVYDMRYYAKNDQVILADIKDVFPKFMGDYPSHPYTTLIKNGLYGLSNIKQGQKVIDVNLPDLAGKPHSISELSKGKIALIDFWGSWCGPCIAVSRTMLPVYQEFKDKGFTIIGIAKEYKTTKNLAIALKREKYPWVNLVEMDDKNQVWNKFGIVNTTGMVMLVDKDGKIISIDPTAEEVKKELLARL